MNSFIMEQIHNFDKKWMASELLEKYYTEELLSRFLVIFIKNNKLSFGKYKFNNENLLKKYNILNRKRPLILFFKDMLKKYIINDTIIILYIADGYCYDNTPVFSYAVPLGINGLIIPHFDIIKITELAEKFNNYNPPQNKIKDDIYFKGGPSSIKRSRIREKLENENLPINVVVHSKEFEEPQHMKDHKYLLDLCGVKPQSLRFKLLTLTDRFVIRISFYDSSRGEIGYWKQYCDYLYKENRDYIHLQYDFNYDKVIPENIYNKVVSDIKTVYDFIEARPKLYNSIVSNMNTKSKKLTYDNALKYTAKLINAYTKNILIYDL